MRLFLAGCLASTTLVAQPPGSVATHPLLIPGPSVIDAAGNVYATSSSSGGQVVTPGAAQTQFGGGVCLFTPAGPAACTDAVIAKVDAAGNTVYSTYLGGPKGDGGNAIAVDAAGNVYVTGFTGGMFPTTPNAAIAASTTSMAFVAKLSADGSKVLYSTYLPDTVGTANGIAIDAQGNALIAGTTTAKHASVVKVSADGSSFLYTAVLAGGEQDAAMAVAVDAAGNAFVTGSTSSADFPVSPGAVQAGLGGVQNAFLAKLDASGNVIFSTFLGGSGTDVGNAVQVDAGGNMYVVGGTTSLDFPTTAGSFQPAPLVPAWSISPGGFVAKVSADGGTIAYATYAWNVGVLALSAAGDAYVAGVSGGFFPVTPSAPQQCVAGSSDIVGGYFVAHLDGQGAVVDATYAGDEEVQPFGLAVAADGSVLLASLSGLSQIHFGGAGWTAPACMTATVLSAATLSATNVAPGEFVSLIGFGIGPDVAVSAQAGAGGSPVMLGGVEVLFDGTPAPVVYAQSRQVNAQAPFELSGQKTTTVTLQYNGATFGPVTVPVQFAYPNLFRLQPNISAQAYAVNQDGTINGPSNPASRGSVIALWGNGFGPTSPACATGGLNAPGPVSLAADPSVIVTGGGAVQYAGSAPTLACGVVQINMQVPVDRQPGAITLFPGVTMGETGAGNFVGSVIYIK